MNGEEEKERRQGLFYLLEGAVCGLLAGSLAVGYRLALEGAGVFWIWGWRWGGPIFGFCRCGLPF